MTMYPGDEPEREIKRCLNCGTDLERKEFLYSSVNFCCGMCKDAYVYRKDKKVNIQC